jgi:hypothetical protein
LQLVVTGVQRVAKLLDDGQQATYAELLAPYQQGKAEQFVYRVKGKAATQEALQAAGEVLATLLPVVAGQVDGEAAVTYQTVVRLYAENFRLTEEQTVCVRGNDEITSGALQSLDDLEASYRRKGGHHYKGYVVNVAETADPGNELQLITHVQVAPNNTEDATLLAEALPALKARTALTDLYGDGGYGSPDTDLVLHDQKVNLHQTHLRGKAPDPTRYCLADFDIAFTDDGNPAYLGCPHGQIVPIVSSRKRLLARFDAHHCQSCPAFQTQCRVRPLQQEPVCHLSFPLADLLWAARRQRFRRLTEAPGDPRAAIEATIRSLKLPFAGRLPVRGLRRVTDMLIGAAAMANIRTIVRFKHRKRQLRPANQTEKQIETGKTSIQERWDNALASFLSFFSLCNPTIRGVFAKSFSC